MVVKSEALSFTDTFDFLRCRSRLDQDAQIPFRQDLFVNSPSLRTGLVEKTQGKLNNSLGCQRIDPLEAGKIVIIDDEGAL